MQPSDDRDGIAFVLDDEAAIAAVVCKVLEQCGKHARAFSDPTVFIAEVASNPPDVIVLDLSLGRSDAIEVIRKLESIAYKGSTILMSGRSMELLNEIAMIGKARGLAMLPPLKKPFKPADLKARLEFAPQGAEAKPAPKPAMEQVELKQAIDNNWLELWYQPKVDLKTLSICGVEALIRVNHPQLGILAPAQFLPPAGDPLYHPLSKFVIAKATSDWKAMAAQNVRPKIAINMPASVVLEPAFVATIRDHLPADEGFPGMIVEVTEDEMVRDSKAIREIAMQLKLSSVDLSIDDFGTAHASLARLRDLPCSELKLDRSFVSNCSRDEHKRNICQIVLDLARKFNVSACVEGVETKEDLAVLTAMGFDTAQGYIFSKPMSLQAFIAVMMHESLQALKRDLQPAPAFIGPEEYRPAAIATYAKNVESERRNEAGLPLNFFYKTG